MNRRFAHFLGGHLCIANHNQMLHFSLYVTERDKPAGSPIDFGKRGKGLYGKCCVPRVMSLEMDRRIGPTLVLGKYFNVGAETY